MVTSTTGSIGSSFREQKTTVRRARNIILIPGKVSEGFFDILIELSAIHSKRIINALREHLVSGESRKKSCERHGANISYFSVALGRLFYVAQLISQLESYYYNEDCNS